MKKNRGMILSGILFVLASLVVVLLAWIVVYFMNDVNKEYIVDVEDTNQEVAQMQKEHSQQIKTVLQKGNQTLLEWVSLEENSEVEQTREVYIPLEQSVQETNYYCAVATLQMVLKNKGIDMSQDVLANEMNTVPITGTEYVDLARVANKYLFQDEYIEAHESGYRVQTLQRYEQSEQMIADFERRVKLDMSTNDPVFVAIEVHTIYPEIGYGNHMIIVTGYTLKEGSDEISHYYYIDPSYLVQDEVYGGLKIVEKELLYQAIVDNVEPAYIY